MVLVLTAFLAGVALAIFESTFLNAADIAGIRPDLAVLVVVVATCRADFRKAMVLAFMLGLTRDFFSGGTIGMSAFSLTLVAYILTAAQDYLLTDSWAGQIFVVFIGSVIYGILFGFLKLILVPEIGSPLQILTMVLWTTAYTSAVAPVAFMLVKKPPFPSYMRLKMKYHRKHETLPPTEV